MGEECKGNDSDDEGEVKNCPIGNLVVEYRVWRKREGIMFENISDKDLYQIYQELWENKILPGEVINTWWNHGDDSRDSKNSYQFLIPNVNYKKITRKDVDCIRSEIKRIFQIKSPSFTKQFEDACCGDGKEYKEIMRLHSSALCALLFFCEVRKNNKLCLEINGNQYSFYEAMFEYKNKVITRASNVDIVLIGENISTGNSAILFLESKFSEYVISKNQKSEFNEIGIDYFRKYNDNNSNNNHSFTRRFTNGSRINTSFFN